MKATTMRTAGVIFSAGILLTSCVSSKKYHRSQDEVAKLRADSTTLAQQASTLQQNLTASEQKATDLQKSVETATNTNAGLQKNVAYYSDFATKEQSTATQIKDELNTTLSAAGLSAEDVTMVDGKIYVNIGEKSLFKNNSAVLTSKGKDLVNNLGEFVKSHDAVDVTVADLEQSNSAMANGTTGNGTTTTMTNGSNGTDASAASSSTATNNNADYTAKHKSWSNSATSGTADKTAHKVAVHHKKKVTATSGESKSVAYSSGTKNKYTSERNRRSTARALAWKRQNAVADAMLKNGLPKVKLLAQDQPAAAPGAAKGVQVVLVHGMDEFYKHMSEAPAAGQPVSKNP